MKNHDAAAQKAAEIAGRPPGTTDGRNIDPALGLLQGEAAGVSVGDPGSAWPVPNDVGIPGGPATPPRTYYGLPSLKQPVWKGYIPLYFHLGGMAGAAAALGAAAQLVDGRAFRGTITASRWVAAAGTAVGATLLISDLGKPTRFLNMMRVVRPTSPMNVGTWILLTTSAASAGAALLADQEGWIGKAGDVAALVAGATGLPLSTYTAVLLSNTAVPVWRHARRALPVVFAGSAISAGAAAVEALAGCERDRRLAKTFGVIGKATELAGAYAVDAELRLHPAVAPGLRQGTAGVLWTASKVMSAGALALAVWPGRSRRRTLATVILSTAASVTTRFALMRAGKRSARDPEASFAAQATRAT